MTEDLSTSNLQSAASTSATAKRFAANSSDVAWGAAAGLLAAWCAAGGGSSLLPAEVPGNSRRRAGEIAGREYLDEGGRGSLTGDGGGTPLNADARTNNGHLLDLPVRKSSNVGAILASMRTALCLWQSWSVAIAWYRFLSASSNHTETKLKSGASGSSFSRSGSSVKAGYWTPSSSKMRWPCFKPIHLSCAAYDLRSTNGADRLM
mmetsp:Transcript_98658/g.274604  ORF Transcript_98658/g.274604 Transcript_98658/m.274604 type:complete len:206 (+) Transcript_98658:352-969(+)